MRSFTKSLIATAIASLLMASANAPALSQSSEESVLTIATQGEPPTLDPVGVTADLVGIITQHVFETLFTFDKEWAVIPLLAAEAPTLSDDGLVYTIPLRTGVKFHDGSVMNADDVVASLERWTTLSPRGKTVAPSIASIVAKDPATVVITLNETYAPLLPLLSMNNGAAVIVPKAQINEDGSLKEMIGTGPYSFLEHKPDQYIRLVRFDDYSVLEGEPNGYGGARVAKIKELRFVPVPNATTRVEGVIAGQYQYAGPLATEMLPRLKAAEGVTSMMVKPFGFPLMFMNTREGLLANEKMRLAVQAALGEDDMMLAAFGDPSFYDIEGSIYAPGSFYYDKASTEGYYNQNDPKKAAELAKAAGYNGEPIRILSSQHHDFLYKMSLVVQAQLEQAGFKVDMQIVDWATVMHKRTDASLWDIFFTYHTFVAEPSLLTFTNPSYPGWWNTPEKKAALAAFNSELDPAKRKELWIKIQGLFYSQAPAIKPGDFYMLAAKSNRLEGLSPRPWPFFWNADIK